MKRLLLLFFIFLCQLSAFSQRAGTIHVVRKKSYYRGERVNQKTRKDFKKGKWITLYDNNRLKSEEFYAGSDFHWDSAYFYYQSTGRLERKLYHVKLSDSAVKKREYNDRGVLTKTFLWNGEEVLEPEKRTYYPSGAISSETYPFPKRHKLNFFESGEVEQYTSFNFEGKIDTVKSFYKTGILKELSIFNRNEKPRYVYTYDEQGDLISYQDVYQRSRTNRKYLMKTDSIYVVELYYNDKHLWTDRGMLKDGELWNGTRTSTQEGAHPRVFVNGSQNGIYYQGDWVNRSDSSRQQGTWYKFHLSNGAVSECTFYKNGVLDSVFRYYESGAIATIQYSRGEFSNKRRKVTRFSEDGDVMYEEGGFMGDTSWVSYYPTGEIHRMKKGDIGEYEFEKGSSCKYTIKRTHRVSYNYDLLNSRRDLQGRNGPYFDFYRNCKHYKRITSKYYELPYDAEGEEKVRNHYQIEKGNFKDDQLYSGIREYYDAEDKLIRTVRVVNGKEQ